MDIGSTVALAMQTMGKGMQDRAARRRGTPGDDTTGDALAKITSEWQSQNELEKKRQAQRSVNVTGRTNVAGIQGGMNEGEYPQKKKGGRIKRTGIYRLHKNEIVVPAREVKRLDRLRRGSRKSGRR